ncbi:DASS family sodium-coupled anion symporter [Algivirga pacifica]|uniref:SLC13 family permease n=1 Tax=Algivirga pacifica TaxID=1162670 RepID=UPI0031F1BFA0
MSALLPSNIFPNPDAQLVIAIGVWMIVWWASETVHIAVTALLPMILLPLTGIMDIKETTAPYSNPMVYLFMGGFMIALAMEKWNLHRRIALSLIRIIGSSANRIILGFMVATALLSMWISNTATTVMMLPIATSVINWIKEDEVHTNGNFKYFTISLLLGIAYAANIGGIATLIGTPPNIVTHGILTDTYDTEISFLKWMVWGVPVSVILLVITYWFLTRWLYPNDMQEIKNAQTVFDLELQKLGKLTSQEKLVLAVFSTTALLWISRSVINQFSGLPLTDTGIAMTGAVLLFVLPANRKEGTFLLCWKDTKKLPWGILILFGGGLSMAGALSKTGVIQVIGDWVQLHAGFNTMILIFVLIAVMVFMTEVMSNVALTSIFIPVVASIAIGLGEDLLEFVVPITMAASCAFMLPMATPPNAIVFSNGDIHVSQMMRTGIWLNLLSIVVLGILAQMGGV